MIYESAIKMIETKLEVLSKEYKITGQRNPIDSVRSRIKTPVSIANKLEKRNLPISFSSMTENLCDIAGIRVICPYISDIYLAKDILLKQPDIKLISEKDYIQNPKESGYRSLHIVVEVPVSYSEDDITIYMGDKLFNNLPADKQYSKQFFGKNEEHIFDVYFEYDGFEHNDETNHKEPNLEWDSHYDKNINNQDVELENFKLIRLKLVVKFDRFDIQYGSDDNAPKVLEEVFMATVSNDENEYSLELTLDPENIEYSK